MHNPQLPNREAVARIIDPDFSRVSWEGDEDEQNDARMIACAKRREQWPPETDDDDCDRDGSCDECTFDMAKALETAASKDRRNAALAKADAILALIPSPDQGEGTAKHDAGVEQLISEWERLERAWHDALPQVQGDPGDGGEAGRAMCQFLYEHSEELRAALAAPPVDSAKPGHELPEDIRRLLADIGEAEWGQTPAHDPEGHGAHVADSVRLTTKQFGLGDEPRHMDGLYVKGTETVICHTGVSPNSPKIARALTGLWNYHRALSASLPEPQLGVEGDGVRRLRAAAERACDWFELALGDGDAGTDFLNEGGWDDTPSIAENLRSALTVTSKEGV